MAVRLPVSRPRRLRVSSLHPTLAPREQNAACISHGIGFVRAKLGLSLSMRRSLERGKWRHTLAAGAFAPAPALPWIEHVPTDGLRLPVTAGVAYTFGAPLVVRSARGGACCIWAGTCW